MTSDPRSRHDTTHTATRNCCVSASELFATKTPNCVPLPNLWEERREIFRALPRNASPPPTPPFPPLPLHPSRQREMQKQHLVDVCFSLTLWPRCGGTLSFLSSPFVRSLRPARRNLKYYVRGKNTVPTSVMVLFHALVIPNAVTFRSGREVGPSTSILLVVVIVVLLFVTHMICVSLARFKRNDDGVNVSFFSK